jgi:hypothetical protein
MALQSRRHQGDYGCISILLFAFNLFGSLVQDDTLKLVLEPLDGVFLGDLVVDSNTSCADLSLGNAGSRSVQADEKVHSVDTSGRIVLDTQIDVLVDSETKVSGLGEVSLKQFVLLDLEAALNNLKRLFSAYGDVHTDLFVTTNAKGTKRVAGFAVDGLLAGQLFQHTSSSRQTISRFSDAAIDNELVDLDIPHGVDFSFFGHGERGMNVFGLNGSVATRCSRCSPVLRRLLRALFFFRKR